MTVKESNPAHHSRHAGLVMSEVAAMAESLGAPVLPDGAGTHVAIVGGGASGVLMATHLLSRPEVPFRVTIVEGRHMLGCGIAYSTRDPHHLLNTRVHNMSAFPDDPDHFRRWLCARSTGVADTSFVSRGTYGAYLADLLAPWQGSDRLACVQQTCLRVDDSGEWPVLHLDDGSTLSADHVVLATGHVVPAPDPTSVLTGAWDPVPAIDPDATVMIIGTGLSMVDQALSLLYGGHRGEILAVSRRGLLPRGHAPGTPLAITPLDLPVGAPVSALLRQVRMLAREAERQGGSWRDAIDGVRLHVSRLWGGMSPEERRRFLRHAAAWWDIHRHRMPPDSAEAITAAMQRGQLRVIRGAFLDARRDEAGALVARVRLAGRNEASVFAAACIIDCRGIRRDPRQNASPLIADLLARGRARIDAVQIGLDVSPDCRVIGSKGDASPRLRAIGPTSRAAFWEITAIPDIREQTDFLARRIEQECLVK